MVRTQIQLTDEQFARTKRAAAQRGVSMAEVIRQALDQHVPSGHSTTRRRRAVRALGGFRSGHTDVSDRHDDHLGDAFAD